MALFSVPLVWQETVRYTPEGSFTLSSIRGFQSIHGLLALGGALAICALALIHKTKPMRISSPFSVLVAVFLLLIIQSIMSNEPSHLLEFLTGEPYTAERTGDGVSLAVLGLVIAIWGGLGINPGPGNPNWSTYLSLGIQWVLGLGLLVLALVGGLFTLVGGLSALILALPLVVWAAFSTRTVLRGKF